jgi:hypothetical protein
VSKRDEKYQRIEAAKERYRKLSSEKIRKLLCSGYVNEEGQIAYREVLQERGECYLGHLPRSSCRPLAESELSKPSQSPPASPAHFFRRIYLYPGTRMLGV